MNVEANTMAVNELFDFTGRSVVITGGGKGIGKVYVEEFAEAGARVAAADIDVDAAKTVAESLNKANLETIGQGSISPAKSQRRP
jgi:3-oxoacyl-[acyl-carrier protein] reductase